MEVPAFMLFDGINPLPIQAATGPMDPAVHEAVLSRADKGTGEICGLWNSLEVAHYGIGSFFATIVAISITTQIGLDSLFALCSPYTVNFTMVVAEFSRLLEIMVLFIIQNLIFWQLF